MFKSLTRKKGKTASLSYRGEKYEVLTICTGKHLSEPGLVVVTLRQDGSCPKRFGTLRVDGGQAGPASRLLCRPVYYRGVFVLPLVFETGAASPVWHLAPCGQGWP